MSTTLQIPAWIPDTCPQIIAPVQQLVAAEVALTNLLPEKFEYSHVFQQQLNLQMDAWLKSGAVSQDTVNSVLGKARKQLAPLPVGVEFARAFVYNLPRGATMVCTQRDASGRTLLRLLRGARNSLEAGECLVAFMCYRGLLEQVGHMLGFLRDISNLPSGEGFEESCKFLTNLVETASKRLHATRVGWKKIVNSKNLDELIKNNEVGYEKSPDRFDQTSKSCMNGVDLLDKRVRGARAVYDILSEFAHPNIGTLMASTMEVTSETGGDGVVWVHKSLHSGPSFAFLDEWSSLTSILLETVAASASLGVKLLDEFEAEAQRGQDAAKRVIPRFLNSNRQLFDIYSLCPCGSGDKIRFCCGKR